MCHVAAVSGCVICNEDMPAIGSRLVLALACRLRRGISNLVRALCGFLRISPRSKASGRHRLSPPTLHAVGYQRVVHQNWQTERASVATR